MDTEVNPSQTNYNSHTAYSGSEHVQQPVLGKEPFGRVFSGDLN